MTDRPQVQLHILKIRPVYLFKLRHGLTSYTH